MIGQDNTNLYKKLLRQQDIEVLTRKGYNAE